MRFATKFDRWLVMVIALSAVVSIGVLPLTFLIPPKQGGAAPWWLALAPPLIWSIVIPATLPQYYEVREDGLFIRQGWHKSFIPWASLVEIRHLMPDLCSAAVFSTDRLLVVTRESRELLIAVAERERFLTEVAKRCPQLQQGPFGLALPPAPPAIV